MNLALIALASIAVGGVIVFPVWALARHHSKQIARSLEHD